jgi:hypothetical protein
MLEDCFLEEKDVLGKKRRLEATKVHPKQPQPSSTDPNGKGTRAGPSVENLSDLKPKPSTKYLPSPTVKNPTSSALMSVSHIQPVISNTRPMSNLEATRFETTLIGTATSEDIDQYPTQSLSPPKAKAAPLTMALKASHSKMSAGPSSFPGNLLSLQ